MPRRRAVAGMGFFGKAVRRGLASAAVLFVTGPIGLALPDVRTPIDPAKRARVSTSDAVRPSASMFQGDGVIGGRVIRMSEIPLKPAALGDQRANIRVAESREKKLVHTETRKFAVRPQDRDRRDRASDLPASIPRLSTDQFRKIIAAYEEGRVPASALLQAEIGAGENRVSIGDINRFADPRRALEEQGIPVRQAGAGEEEK
ncbi:MAG: hypothetical protein ACREIA_13285 [Opitutaceae bacterium]